MGKMLYQSELENLGSKECQTCTAIKLQMSVFTIRKYKAQFGKASHFQVRH